MKANKALKRLAKIEALISNVTERYSASESQIRDVLQYAKAAVVRAREAVQASSGMAKKSPVKHSQPPSNTVPEPSRPKRELSAAGRKAISEATKKRWAAKKAAAKAGPSIARRATLTKAAAKKAAPLKAANASARAVAKKAPAKKEAAKVPVKKPVKVREMRIAVPKTAATTVRKPEQAVPEAPVQ
jgi:hypothetical protein